MGNRSRKHLAMIQFSRALVPLFVLLFHAEAFMKVYFHYDLLKLDDVPKSGGVYYFFALSGFMAYYIYHKDFGNQKVMKKYFYSRFTKIYPIYWILTLLILPIYFIVPSFGQGNERELSTIVTSFLLFPNQNEPILSVAWSLVHTVFFYMMFAVNFYKNKKMSRLVLWLWGIISFLSSIDVVSTTNYYFNFWFNFNNLIFLAGIACAYLVTKTRLSIPLAIGFIIIGIIGFPLSWYNTQFDVVNVSLQLITGVSSILLMFGLASIDLQKDITIPRIAKFLSDASFSIYLTHFITMSVICKLLSSVVILSIPKLEIGMFIIILSIITGCMVYTLLEKPLEKKFKSILNNKNGQMNKEEIHLEVLDLVKKA